MIADLDADHFINESIQMHAKDKLHSLMEELEVNDIQQSLETCAEKKTTYDRLPTMNVNQIIKHTGLVPSDALALCDRVSTETSPPPVANESNS